MKPKKERFWKSVREKEEKWMDAVLSTVSSCSTKQEMKEGFQLFDTEFLQEIAEAALPKEYYEICQAAKEVLDERKSPR